MMARGSMDRLSLVIVCLTGLSVALAAKWSYEGAAGPHNWHELFPHACSGRHQSPIDIHPEQTMYNPSLKDFAIWYDPPKPDSRMYVKNNGHTVQVDLVGQFYVSNGGLQHMYKSAQFHFHWGHKTHVGSEHLFEGVPSPIEMHLVNFNQDLFPDLGSAATEKGGLAVLGVMYEVSEEDNPVLEPIVKAIKHIRDPETRTRISLPLISLRDMLPEDLSRYYRYNGSLTTPGCFESVTWTVFDQKQTISHRQLKEFRTLLQFRHKHPRGSDSRHKRSLTRAQKRMEHTAEEVLDELGIRGDKFEEDILKAELTRRKLGEMFGDMPHGSSHGSAHNSHGSSHNKHGSKPETSHHTTVEASKKYTPVNPTEPAMAEEEVEFYYTQDILVNNYRPVQPVNQRVVYRSFKLREPHVVVEHEEHGEGHYDVVHTGASHEPGHGGHGGQGDHGGHGDHGGAPSLRGQGVLVALSCLIMGFILNL